MPPSVIKDDDIDAVDPDLYYAMETGTLWKTENLTTAGASTWSESLTTAMVNILVLPETYAAITFLRVRAAPAAAKLVMVMLVGQAAAGAATGALYVARSSNAGNSWSISLVGEIPLTISDYIIDEYFITLPEGTTNISKVVTRHDDGDDVNPWAVVMYTADRYSVDAGDRLGYAFGGFDADDLVEVMGA